MKIQYLGFLPAILIYIWAVHYVHKFGWEGFWFIPAAVLLFMLSILFVFGGIIWALS